MSRKVWIPKLSINLRRRIGWRAAVILAFGLFLVAGMQEPRAAADSQSASAQGQGRKRLVAEKIFDEAKALQKRGTAESLRLAAQKYQEALPLWREIGDRGKEATTLNNIGMVYDSLGEKQKALDFLNQALRLLRATRDRREEGITLFNLGYVYDSLGENEKALDFYNQALRLHRAVRDREGEADTLHKIGHVYQSLGEYRKALDSFTQALSFWRAAGDPDAEAKMLRDIGSVYESQGEKQKAQDFYAQADAPSPRRRRQPAPAQDQKLLAAQRKVEEGKALLMQGTARSLRLAMEKFEEALMLWRVISARDSEADTLNYIGAVYVLMGGLQKSRDFYIQSLDFFNKALPLRREIRDRKGEAGTLSNIGAVYGLLGNSQKALEFYSQALPLYREVRDLKEEAETLSKIGLIYKSLGEWQNALEFLGQALPIARAIGDLKAQAATLNNIGAVYYTLGEGQKALEFYSQALPLYREVRDRYREADMLNDIGAVYASLGEWQNALDFFNKALPLRREIRDRKGEAGTLSNIGAVYYWLGESQKALDFYTKALPFRRELRDHKEEANILDNIGLAYHSNGESQKALEFYDQALSLRREVRDPKGEAYTLQFIGGVYVSLGEWQKALDFLDQALSLHREFLDRKGEAATLNYIGYVYGSLGKKQEALDLLDKAVLLQRAIGNRRGESIALFNLARTKRALGRFDEARSHIEFSLKIIESLRAGVYSKELRASYFATTQDHYEFYIDLLMQMRSREPNKGHDAAALHASERARARSLLDSLAEAGADIRRGVDPELLEQERSLRQRLNTKADMALKPSANGADEARFAALRREIDALTVELQQVQTRISQTSPSYEALTQPRPLTLAEIQRQVLDADTLLLEYSLGEDRSFLWAVTPTTINSYILPKRDEIEAATKRVYELSSKAPVMKGQTARRGDSRLKEAGGDYLAAATSLGRMLLGPVAAQLGKKRLLIVADGALHYIPFGALPDPNSLKKSDGNWQPLVVKHEIVNLPSASTLAVLRRELAGRKPAPKTLAVLADPVFSGDDERIKSVARRAAPQIVQPASNPLNQSITRKLVQIAGGAPSAAQNDLRIKRLPYTRQEADAIMNLAPAGAGMKALDFEASRATATSGQLSQYRYVHFATHGLADSERPELSTLVLSLFDEQGRPQEGFLRAHEVYNLELPAELVTLSACETGLGKLTRGEGLVSLTRGFMYAGAARVVVSLWSVNDRATAELMAKFYRRMLVNGERPAAALRAAQVEMWREKRWEAPYYWAAFTLQGEWR